MGLVVSSLRVRLDLIYFMCDPFIRMSNFYTVRIIRTISITKTDNYLEYQTCIFIPRIPPQKKKRYPPRISDLHIICGRSRQRHFHFFQKVGVKNLMQDAVTVAREPAAITLWRTPKFPKTQNLDWTQNNIVKVWGKL